MVDILRTNKQIWCLNKFGSDKIEDALNYKDFIEDIHLLLKEEYVYFFMILLSFPWIIHLQEN